MEWINKKGEATVHCEKMLYFCGGHSTGQKETPQSSYKSHCLSSARFKFSVYQHLYNYLHFDSSVSCKDPIFTEIPFQATSFFFFPIDTYDFQLKYSSTRITVGEGKKTLSTTCSQELLQTVSSMIRY